MSEKEWMQFFELLHKAVSQPGKTADQKKALALDAAKNIGAEYDVYEFAEWFEDDATTKDFGDV